MTPSDWEDVKIKHLECDKARVSGASVGIKKIINSQNTEVFLSALQDWKAMTEIKYNWDNCILKTCSLTIENRENSSLTEGWGTFKDIDNREKPQRATADLKQGWEATQKKRLDSEEPVLG